jgi:hypothetical protein
VTQSDDRSSPLREAATAWKSLGLWTLWTAALAALLQGAAWAVGGDLSIFGSSTGRSLLLCIALGVLLVMMSADQRPSSHFGIYVGSDWLRQLGRGFLWGVLAYGGFHLAALGLGVFRLQPEAMAGRESYKFVLAAVTLVPLAITQQIMFSGYLLTLLRTAAGRTAGLILCGALFGLASVAGKSDQFIHPDNLRLAGSLSLLATLLGLLRFRHGSIVIPTGVLAGCLLVRRGLWKSHLLTLNPGHPLVDWFAPAADPRQGLALFVLLAGGIAFVAWQLWRDGETIAPASTPALSAGFKQVFPFSCIMALGAFDVWIARSFEARFRIGLKYLPRAVTVLIASAFTTLVTLPERLLAPLLLRHRLKDPVLIVGVHRSGTTHLHNLLALDPQFSTPRLIHILNPFGAWLIGWVITPILGIFMTSRRPMDSVRVHLFSPQEEEFAIACMTRVSPYWGFIFPRETRRHDRFIHPEDCTSAELAEWKRCLTLFLRKVTFWRRGSPLLKSPYNTARAGLFREMFPAAKFVHISRHPHKTYLSNMHLAEHGLAAFQLQDQPEEDGYKDRFLDHYRRMEDAWLRDSASLPEHDAIEIRYEDLVRDPVAEIRRIYATLQLEYTLKFDRRLRKYLTGLEGYRKNRHAPLPTEVQRQIDSAMAPYLARWAYADEARRKTA